MAATLYGACALIKNKIMRNSLGESDTCMKLYEIEKKKAKTKMLRCEGESANAKEQYEYRSFAFESLRVAVASSFLCLQNFTCFAIAPLQLRPKGEMQSCEWVKWNTIGHSK